jgi:hypothetical protein
VGNLRKIEALALNRYHRWKACGFGSTRSIRRCISHLSHTQEAWNGDEEQRRQLRLSLQALAESKLQVSSLWYM